MKSGKYIGELTDGEPVYAKNGLLYFSCCDCGLTHMVVVTTITDTDVELRFFKDASRSFNRRRFGKKYTFTKRK